VLTFVALLGVGAVSGGRALRHGPLHAGAVLGFVCVLGLLLFVLSECRVVSEQPAGRLRVRRVFTSDSLDATRCAFGVSAVSSSRGGTTYRVFACDGLREVVLDERWTLSGARRSQRRLARCFIPDPESEARRVARGRVAREERRFQEQFAAAEAQVARYYASDAHKRSVYWIAGFIILYVLGMILFSWLTGQSL